MGPPPKSSKLPLVLGASGIALVVLFVALRVFVFELYRNPSGSMIPTLAVSARFMVNKLESSSLHRGDVIVFKFPEHPDQDFVKRVIAVGGDVLDVKDGHPSINGWPVPSCKLGEWSYDDADAYGGSGHHKGDVYLEFLESAAYLTFYDSVGAFGEHQGPFHAKPTETWVMGDNRNNSHDSRMWFGGAGGGVPPGNVKGTVIGTHGDPTLPASMTGLASALAKCMQQRPPIAQSTPPPPPRP